MMRNALFGPSGNPEIFYDEGHKSSLAMPEWLANQGLNAYEYSLTRGVNIGEATARAVQRIPDAHCNGDMHAALDYAAKIKHVQKDFLTSQGIHAIID